MNSQLPNQITEYYIAYFDILGYQEFFKETPKKAQDFLNTIHSAITKTKSSVQLFNESPFVSQMIDLQIHTKIFSDNFLLCIEVGKNILKEKLRLILFMSLIAEIQRGFITEYGLFIRGGLTKGTLSFNNDYIFGEGVIEVVKMEVSTQYPRIAISKKVINFLTSIQLYSRKDADRAISIENKSKNREQISEEDFAFYQKLLNLGNQELFEHICCANLVYKCPDGEWCLSYLYCIDVRSYMPKITLEQVQELIKQILSENYEKIPQAFPDIDSVLNIHKSIVEENLVKYSDYRKLSTDDIDKFEARERILKKYVWAMVYHNYMCEWHNKMNYFINTQGNCERRHMRLVINVCDKDGVILNKY